MSQPFYLACCLTCCLQLERVARMSVFDKLSCIAWIMSWDTLEEQGVMEGICSVLHWGKQLPGSTTALGKSQSLAHHCRARTLPRAVGTLLLRCSIPAVAWHLDMIVL